MKRSQNVPGSGMLRTARLGMALLLPLACAALAPHKATAQSTFVKTYRQVEDVKQYSVLAIEGEDEYLMAGTVKNRFIHFMRTDGSGNVLDSRWYDCVTEQRTIKIVALDAGRYAIVALRRDNAGAANARDRIRLLEIDKKGTVISDQLLESTLPAGAANYVNIYPLNALYDQPNNILYLCGYVTKQPSTYPNYPQLTALSDKKAFVFRLDLTAMTAVSSTFDYVYTGVPTLPYPQPSSDFDMAMAMSLVPSSTTPNPSLYVTGSCNFVTPVPVSPATASYRSGTMNLQLNPATLAIVNGATQRSFADPAQSEGGEYGMDIVRNTGTGGGYFVVGNTSNITSQAGTGFSGKPGYVVCTYINSSFNPVVNPSLARLWLKDVRGATALQTIRGLNGGNNVVIAGMQSGASVCPATTTPDPSLDNFNPFLQDFTPSWSGTSIGYTSAWWRTYLTRFGTGVASASNSYYQYGNGLSIFAWSPFLAYRRAAGNPLGDDNIVLTAPSRNPDYNSLNTKLIRAEGAGKVPTCEEGYMTCNIGYGSSSVKLSGFVSGSVNISTPVTTAVYGLAVVPHNEQILPLNPYEVWDCELSGGNLFRSVPQSNGASLSAAVRPNPASDYVQIAFSGELQPEDRLTIQLTDISGRTIGTLYSGKAGAYSNDAHLVLPQTAAGMYFIRISAGDRQLPLQKLILQ